jgi:hypothetical protein
MSTRILHHGRCFDGVLSAALAIRLLRALGEAPAPVETNGQIHRRGPPFDPDAFSAAVNVVVDYRYSPDPRLTWWFDHHATTFENDAHRGHFERYRAAHRLVTAEGSRGNEESPSGAPAPFPAAARSAMIGGEARKTALFRDEGGWDIPPQRRRRFFDPQAPSCARLIQRVALERFGLDLAPRDRDPERDLVTWADRIDTAAFDSPEEAVGLASAPLRLMHWLETAATDQTEPAVVAALAAGTPLEQILASPEVATGLEESLRAHRALIDQVEARLQRTAGVAWVDLADQRLAGINKFIPYLLDPKLRFAVMLLRLPGRVKVAVGQNPWAPAAPDVDVGALCRQHGGGGHQTVGAVSLPANAVEEGRRIAETLVSRLSRRG